jgi:hypothetical protein
MNVDEVDQALQALEAEGARAFDEPACDCARTLYVRAEELGGSVGERLLARAAAHVEALRERFHSQRARVDQALESIADETVQAELAQALGKGEIVRVARSIRRLRRQPGLRRSPGPRGHRLPLDHAEQAAYAPDAQAALNEPTAHVSASDMPASEVREPQTRGDAKRVRRRRAASYEDSVAELVASYALARATDVVPEGAGPYNGLRIASQALDAMRGLSPSYLTVQLNRLEELASLLALPELPPKPKPAPTTRTLPKKRGRTLKG